MSKKNGQVNLFDELGVKREWEEHWLEMPEFIQGNTEPFQSIHIHFKNKVDLRNFEKLIDQKLTYKTKSLWYPKLDDKKPSNYLYVTKVNSHES